MEYDTPEGSWIRIKYLPCEHTDKLEPDLLDCYPPQALAEDFADVMRLALACELDRKRFTLNMIPQARAMVQSGVIDISWSELERRVGHFYDKSFWT